MSNELISTILSVIATVVSIISIVFSFVNNKKTNQLNEIATELKYRELINNATNNLTAKFNYYKTNYDETAKKEVLVSIENYLNIYDDLCGFYLNKKLNKINFYRKFKNDIQTLVENDELKSYFYPKEKSNFVNIISVYELFNKLQTQLMTRTIKSTK